MLKPLLGGRLRAPGFLAALLILVAGCDDPATPLTGGSIPDVLAGDSDFTQLADALEATGLAGTLASPGPYTLFAPDDVAFAYLGEETLALLLDDANRTLLTEVLRYHVVPGRFAVADLQDGQALQTLEGSALVVRREGSTVFVGEVRVSDATITAENGLIHPVSSVLRSNLDLATRLRLTPLVSLFAGYAEQTDVLDDLAGAGPFTVFAPIDDAVTALGPSTVALLEQPANTDVLAQVVNAHVAEGIPDLAALASGATIPTRDGSSLTLTRDDVGVLYLDGHRVVSTPVPVENGVLYLVDGLFLDGLSLDARLRISPTLTTFYDEIEARPDLRALLSGDAPYTVFAYTNTGWDGLHPDVRSALRLPENATLLDRIVRVHIVPGRYASAALTDGLVLESLEGTPLRVVRGGGDLFVGDREVQTADIEAENGVLHIVSGVILPTLDLLDTAVIRAQPAYAQAVRRAGLEGLLRGPGPLTVFAFTQEVFEANPLLLSNNRLDDILLYHIADEALAPLRHGLVFESLEGTNRTIAFDPIETVFRLDGVAQIGAPTAATNGFFYTVDGLSTPPLP